jgi:hypothetical protein
MLAAEIGVAALALFFHLRTRPQILAAFSDFDTALPRAALLALSPWFMPAALAVAGICTLAGLLAPLRRTRRTFLVGLGLLVAAGALIFAVWVAFVPVFQPGSALSASSAVASG